MKPRFAGNEGQRLLAHALLSQKLVQHDSNLAREFVTRGSVSEIAVGATLIEQGAADNHLYFIIAGSVSVHVHGKHVATRGPGEVVGEMAMVDPAAPRSASVKVIKPLTTLRITEPDFSSIAVQFPQVWKGLALLICEKLRQRGDAIKQSNPCPILFVGSSVEGLSLARHVQANLKHEAIDVRLWADSVFGPSGVAIESLMEQVDAADYALFVFGPDDKIASRAKEYDAPRDNVIFELGLFMGNLSRSRTFFIMQHGADLKFPSDLLGVTPLTYVRHAGANMASALGPPCTELISKIKQLGVR